jgi:hypothetical protein
MTSTHRLTAIVVVWLAFAWMSFFCNNAFMPASAIPILNVIYVVAALLVTFIIMRIGGRNRSS